MTKKPASKPKQKPSPPAAGEVSASSENAFPIVGIGASAGGLAAFEAFFSAMPAGAEPGMAFVLVQHLSPDHKSILTELVRRYTSMEVFEVGDGMTVRPNCAYIIPPRRDMAFLNGSLQLLEPTLPRGLHLPIDFFFRSLAQDQRDRAIGIVLSGTGSDGALGARAIKGEGGMVMVQEPESAEYDGMPRSALGMADYVLKPAEMPAQLLAYAAHAAGKLPRLALPDRNEEGALKKIFTLLRGQTGHDFSHYKQNTVVRRIERRMTVHQIANREAYVRYLQQTPAEVDALFHDLLIGVTSFFRDPKAFDALREQVIPRLFADKTPGAFVRVWVPGCSTGEEAFSIAMLLQEQMDALKQTFKVQVFATDIDHRAIEQARSGIYPISIAADVSQERLSRFFERPDRTTFRIQKGIRDLLIFSEQDLIKDPPFSKLDLISCRNLLIYLDGVLQKRLIPLFHYALNPGGFLFLGTSESVGDSAEHFFALDRKAKLYQRRESVRGAAGAGLARLLPVVADEIAAHRVAGKPRGANVSLRELTERSLLQQYSPVGALVNVQGDILFLHGRTGNYLEPAPGEAGMNIFKMAREGLKRELALALHSAVLHRKPVSRPGVRVKTNSHFTAVNLTVRPVATDWETSSESLLYLVILEEVAEAPPAAVVEEDASLDIDARVAALKEELKVREEYLQSAKEELETSNEELKSSNEEMQSINEELQSTNEELETSKEELQSVNEELATVNAELQTKVADLSRANDDMNNLLAGMGMGTIFVDHQLRIQRFTPAVTDVINLIASDLGRPVGHIASNLVGYDSLVPDVQDVLDNLIPKEIEVRTHAGSWYLLGIRPYRTLENVIEGAVVTFVDITQMKNAQEALREALRRMAAVVHDSSDAITVQNLDGRILAWNPEAERMYGWNEDQALKMNICDMIPADRRADAMETVRQLSHAKALKPYRMQRLAKDGRVIEVSVAATALVNEAGKVYAIATTERNAQEAAREEAGRPG